MATLAPVTSEGFTLGSLKMEERSISYLDRGETITIDLAKIAKMMNRLGEVAGVNQRTAPELLSTLNETHLDLGKLVTMLAYRIQLAKSRLRREKARILVDVVPGILKERQLPSSADLRAALVDTAEGVVEAQDTVDQLEAILALMKCKREAAEWAFTAIKRLLGEGQLRGGLTGYAPSLSQPLHKDDKTPLGQGETSPGPAPGGAMGKFGRAKY